jgi:hypothetical protein
MLHPAFYSICISGKRGRKNQVIYSKTKDIINRKPVHRTFVTAISSERQYNILTKDHIYGLSSVRTDYCKYVNLTKDRWHELLSVCTQKASMRGRTGWRSADRPCITTATASGSFRASRARWMLMDAATPRRTCISPWSNGQGRASAGPQRGGLSAP